MSRALRGSVVAGFLVCTGGCGGGEPGSADAAEARGPDGEAMVQVEMSAQPYLAGTVLRIGLEEGYFADEGIDFRLHPTTESGSRSLPALDRGLVDVATQANLVALLNAIGSGARVKAVAAGSQFPEDGCSFAGLVARQGLFEEGHEVTPEDLRGLKVDLNPLTFEGYFLDTFLRGGGLTMDDMQLVPLPLAARIEAMDRGGIDLTIISEPWLTRLQERGHRLVLGVDEVTPGTPYSVYAFGSRLLEEDRDVGRRWVRGYLKAVRQFNEGATPRNVEIAALHTGLDRATLEKVCWPRYPEDGRLDVAGFEAMRRWAMERGHVDHEVATEEFWDGEFTGMMPQDGGAGR